MSQTQKNVSARGSQRVAEILDAHSEAKNEPQPVTAKLENTDEQKEKKRPPIAFFIIPRDEVTVVATELSYGSDKFIEAVAMELRELLAARKIVDSKSMVIVTFIRHNTKSTKNFMFYSDKTTVEKFSKEILFSPCANIMIYEILMSSKSDARIKTVLMGRDAEKKIALTETSTEKPVWPLARYYSPI